MDFIRILEQAQQGNYDSYELLVNHLQGTPSDILSFFEYFCNADNPKTSKELVGLFLKNWLGKCAGQGWWAGFGNKLELVQKVLLASELPNVTSMILAGFLSSENLGESSQIVHILISNNSKSSVLALSYYLENSRTVLQAVQNYIISILPTLLQSDPLLALQVFQKSVKHLVASPVIFSLFGPILSIPELSSNDLLIIEAYKSLVDIISYFYENLSQYFDKIIQFVIKGVLCEDSQISRLSYECLNVLVDVERQRKQEGLQMLNIVEKYSEVILLELMKKIEQSEEYDEILQVSSTIQGICEVIHDKVQLMLPAIGEKLNNPNLKSKVCGVYVLGSILPSLSPEKIQAIKVEVLAAVNISLNDQSPEMKKASIWLVYKIAENIPEIIHNFPLIFELLYQSLDNPQKVVIDCLLEVADGDILLPHPEKFIEKLMHLGLNTKFVNSFNVVRAIIQSMDTESTYLKTVIESLMPLISSNHKHLPSLSIILRACLEKLSESQVLVYYQPLFSILLNIPQNDEYMVAISCLSRHPAFKNYILNFTSVLSSALTVRESFQSAIICVSELVRNLEFSDWLPPLMPGLIKLLDTKVQPNTQIIEALTDIISLHTETCLGFLQDLLRYTDYCVQFALSDYDDPEFLAEIRELLVSFYEGLIQGLENIGKIELIAIKVQDILKFCIFVTSDDQMPGPNIVAGAIGIFADIALAFGEIPEKEKILKFVKQFMSSDSEMVRMNAECALKTISQLG
jgi:hypothetical protein